MTAIGKKIMKRLGAFTEALESKTDLSERFTCRKIVLDLRPDSYTPQLVKKTRGLLGLSQALFANFLGVSRATVCAWEGGRKTPSELASRFMDEIRADPEHWRKRLHDQIVAKVD